MNTDESLRIICEADLFNEITTLKLSNVNKLPEHAQRNKHMLKPKNIKN